MSVSSNAITLAAEFHGNFTGRHMVLFVGKSINDEALREYIAKLPWSCVVTSRTDYTFGTYFQSNDERKVVEYLLKSDVPSRPLSKQGILPILRLYGQNTPIDINDLAIRGVTKKEYLDNQARKMIEVVPDLFRFSNVIMTVVGYDPDDLDDLPYSIFADILVENNCIRENSVQIWGLDSTGPMAIALHRLADSKGFVWHEEELHDVLKVWNESEKKQEAIQDPISATSGLELFYKGDKTVGLPIEHLVRYRNLAQLLTEQCVYANSPYGRLIQARWFYNFLTLSSTEGPQWYGYLKSSDFHVKRDYEDTLVDLVRRKLINDSPIEDDDFSPIILYGDPASSKSITLGALAYRVFNEHNSPVVFIKNDALLFTTGSDELEELDRLLEMIDKVGPSTRILIVWDCSSYRNVTTNALRLAKYLNKIRGRRCILVCSAYNTISEKNGDATFLKYERTEKDSWFSHSRQNNYDLFYMNGCFFIHADRIMSEKEQGRFWQKLTEYSGMSSDQKKKAKDRIKDDSDIFDYYYKILGILRPKLEHSLTREERRVTQYVNRELRILGDIIAEEKQNSGSFAEAFKRAGIDISSLEMEFNFSEQDEKLEAEQYDLDRFNYYIAMFSRFKIEVSLSLALQLLKSKELMIEDYSISYNAELIKLITTRIPWLRYGDSADGSDYAFRFRNTKEAELFLQRNQVDGEEQANLLCDIIELYGSYYEHYQQPFDMFMGRNLQDLIRLMGPNSQYAPFKAMRGTQNNEYNGIMRSMENIIDMLNKLCNDYCIPDEDAGFAILLITFTREYYGVKWRSLYHEEHDLAEYTEEKYLYRIMRINRIIQFAIKTIDDLKITIENTIGKNKRHLSDQYNGLTVELALCNVTLHELKREYMKVYKGGIETSHFIGVSYEELFDRLRKVIISNPSNGHAYNALFRAFEDMYENSRLSERKKLQYLTAIQLIADDCDSVDIQNRGADERDEISEHLLKLRKYSTRYEVSIDDIHNGNVDSEFAELYDNLIEMRSPAAIAFVCQQELRAARIDYKTETLNNSQQETCRKIMEYMQEDCNVECIENNYFALLLLLRVTWMFYTKRALRDRPECQTIVLSTQQWETIRKISEACVMSVRQTTTGIKPVVGLIYALSTLQTNDDYKECEHIVNSISDNEFMDTYTEKMRVPFIVCNEEGPRKYSGLVKRIENNKKGWIRIDNIPTISGSIDRDVFFHINNFGVGARMPVVSQRLSDLELGLGYRGFSVYTELGRRKKADQK